MNLKFWEWLSPSNATMKEPEWLRQALNVNPVASGAMVTQSTAVTVAAVWACVRVIAESIASLPAHLYERTAGGRELAIKHPLYPLIHALPNSEQTALDLYEHILSNVLLRGTGYALQVRDGRGVLREIHPLKTAHMHPDRDASGRLIFDYQETGNAGVYTPDRIWRVKGLGHDGVTGLSPIALGRESIGVALSAEEQAAKLFSNGMQAPRHFEIPTALSDQAFQRLKQDIDQNYSGSANAFKTLILENGLTLKSVGFTPEDSQFLESRKFQISEIARWFRVPMHMLNELDRATFSNIEHQSIEFVRDTLRPWIRRLEMSMYRDLLTTSERQRYFVEFTIDALLRGDTQTRYEAYGKAINDGWLSRNEVRNLENRNAVDGLDEYLVPLNMSKASEKQQQAQAFVDREVKAVAAEHGRHEAGAFQEWVFDFYARHVDFLISNGIDPQVACPYCEAHAAALRIDVVDVAALLKRWQRASAAELMK